MSSSRARLAAIITPMLPTVWRRRVTDTTVKSIGTLAAPSVFIDFTTMTHDGMPPGQLVDGFEIALVSHLTDYAKAEDDLDSATRTLVRAIDASDEVAWSTALKREFADKYLGWVVTVQLLTPITEQD